MATLQDLALPKSASPKNPELKISTQLPTKCQAPWPWSRDRLAGESNVGLGHEMPHPALLPVWRQPAVSCVSTFRIIKMGVSLHNHNSKGIFSSTGRQRRPSPPQIKLAETAYARSSHLPSTTPPMDLFLLTPLFRGLLRRNGPAP